MNNELKARISLDTALLARGLQQSQTAVRNWAGNLKSHIATAFSAAAVTAAIRSTSDVLQGMGDAGDRMGRTVEEVQMLAQVATLAGTELSKVENILMNISEAQIDALSGNEKKMKLFNDAGIDKTTLNKTNELGILQLLSSNMQGKNTPELRAGLTDIIGKKNVGPFQAMQGDMADFANKLRLALSRNDVISAAKITQLKIASDQLAVTWEIMTNRLKDMFLPLLTEIVEQMVLYLATIKAYGLVLLESMKLFQSNGLTFKSFYVNVKSVIKEWSDTDAEIRRNKEAAKTRVKQAAENAAAGPNLPPPAKKSFRFDIEEKVFGEKPAGNVNPLSMYSSTGGFAGSDMRMIQGVSVETNNILREQLRIQKKQLEEMMKMALNRSADALSVFGINF